MSNSQTRGRTVEAVGLVVGVIGVCFVVLVLFDLASLPRWVYWLALALVVWGFVSVVGLLRKRRDAAR